MRVFISHHSSDKPTVKPFVEALKERGIHPWLDQMEIGPGDDIVKSINDGLEECQAGIIVFSQNTMASKWVEAEVNYLIYAKIKESKVLIPVMVEDEAFVPPLIRPLAWRNISEIDAIVDALKNRSAGPPPKLPPEWGRIHRVELDLKGGFEQGISAELKINGDAYASETRGRLTRTLVDGLNGFMRGVPAGARRDVTRWDVKNYSENLTALGRELTSFLLPEEGLEALVDLVKATRKMGQTLEWIITADHSEVLGLPFEAMRLPDDRLLALEPQVVTMRRPAGMETPPYTPMAGPLKVLVAIGAPDEDQTKNPVLDFELETQNILDAVEPLRMLENAAVRILEVAQPSLIAKALKADAYHVLHLSCHGGPGVLMLSNELGEEVETSASELIEPLLETKRPLPLVFLNSCHGGVHAKETASFAESLLKLGVPAVLAMQTSVSDRYATRLAQGFYAQLAVRENLLPSHALAEARRGLEKERLKAVKAGGVSREHQPEFATATLYIAKSEPQLADFGLNKEPLRKPPVYEVAGPVPQLEFGDLIGRRKELREAKKILFGKAGQASSLALTGMGGIGKSALAGRIMRLLKEEGWIVAAYQGKFDLMGIAQAISESLFAEKPKAFSELANQLVQKDLDEKLRLGLICRLLQEQPILLVLDDFEENLILGEDQFKDPEVAKVIQRLVAVARKGKLLFTCRYPIPGPVSDVQALKVPPLSDAASRKLAFRLPSFQQFDHSERQRVQKLLGGHPRMLELLDALLQAGEARFDHVKKKLDALFEKRGLKPGTFLEGLPENLQLLLTLGMRDILLEELFELVQKEGLGEFLLQVAVSNLPVSVDGLARMLAKDPSDQVDAITSEAALSRFESLGLLFRDEEGDAHVHRWTAEGLKEVNPEHHLKRCIAAGRYRMWRVEHETKGLADGMEATRNFLEGKAFDEAVEVAEGCIAAMIRFQQILSVASLAAEVLAVLPEDHASFASISDQEAQAFLALGQTQYAFRRYEKLLEIHEKLVETDPENANHQRTLSITYNKMGDLYSALGEGEKARQAFLKSLEIFERLAASEPDRADYQRDLAASYERMGDVFLAEKEYQKAHGEFVKAYNIRVSVAQKEPARADYLRELVIPLWRLGLFQLPESTELLEQALGILVSLKEAGRLNPVDESMIGELQATIKQAKQDSNK